MDTFNAKDLVEVKSYVAGSYLDTIEFDGVEYYD